MTNEEYGTFLYGEALYGLDGAFAVISAVPSYLSIRVTFNYGCVDNDELRNPENYQIVVSSPSTAYDFGIVSVTPEDVEYPTYVDLEVTDCTGDADYTLVITPDVIQSQYAVYLTSGSNTAAFVGDTEDPTVLYAIALSPTTIRVVFSKYMVQNADLYDRTNYAWSGSNLLTTLRVERESNSSVILTTTTQTAGTIYELTVG